MSSDAVRPQLPFTGERFTPECLREIWYEHWHRYVFASQFTAGKRVLDAACGEGYGSELIARNAASVLGLDLSEQAIAHARTRYAGRPSLSFEQGDCTSLSQPLGSFDIVLSFETLEHVAEQERMLAGFAAALKDDGLLILSSPDKHTYSEIAGFRNEFHVRELFREELLAILAPHFPALRLYGQKLLFQSAIWPLTPSTGAAQLATTDSFGNELSSGLSYAPLYFIVVCAKNAAALPPEAAGLSLFGDREESVYAHYNHEVRKNMQAGGLLAALQQENAALVAENATLGKGIAALATKANAPIAWWQRWWRR